MAGPLRWFRKYEKILLGVFGVALMIAFTFSLGVSSVDLLGQLAGTAQGPGGGGGPNDSGDPVVASWTGGDYRESDFRDLEQGRRALIAFMRQSIGTARQRGGQQRGQAIPPSVGDGSLLELAILSNKADEMGLQVSDQGILDYLTQLTDGQVTKKEFQIIWNAVTSNQSNDKQLLALLRRELLAMRYRGMMQSGAFPVSPLRFWDFYNRLERTVKAEVMPLPVENFVAEVDDPPNATLTAFFDKYKHQYTYPGSPEPGFRQRERAAFSYVKFDYEKFFEAELALVTDEQVAKYYEENKEEFREQSFLEDDLTVPDVPDSTPMDTDAGAESSVPETPAAPAGEAPAAPAAGEAAETVVPDAVVPDPQPTPSPNPQDAAPEVVPATEVPTVTAEAQVEKVVGETAETVQTIPTETAESSEVKAEEVKAEVSAEEPAADETKMADKEEEEVTKYKPIEKVTDEIKRILARPLAQQKMDKAIRAARAKSERYFRETKLFELQTVKNEDAKAPTPPDFSDIESPTPLVVENVAICDEVALSETELSKSFDVMFDGQGLQQVLFTEVAFNKNLSLNQAGIFPSSEAAQTKYLYWRTEHEQATEPKLEDIRTAVVSAWKMQQAKDLALAAAESAAKTARESDKPLSESIPGENRTFFETNQITWLSGGNVPLDTSTIPQPTMVEGVDAGDDFYRALFSLSKGEVGVAVDQGNSNAYVIRAIESGPRSRRTSGGIL